MLNTSPTTVLPAAAGFEVLALEGAGEISKWPILGWAVTPLYGYGRGGSIQPITLGVVFSADVRGIGLPDGRIIYPPYATEPTPPPRWQRPPLPSGTHLQFSLRGKFATLRKTAPKFCTTPCAVGAGATASKG
jgi:hypothetical protein